ncbi:hypothetical protein [Alkalihalobacillus trypoxylicola]|uniref:Uncharacterized protein n=1 Tax=Alkalihalobacillus trypoxylicola TaxID=519424 RepID=A0A162CXG5_9BACI|nr:hypothetical protein [Alkalihalobacillus trypoxylicola]KYG27033.1 hypothetical protein AZF04_11910 [Alkalihalobacillus trypoxylicola]
MLIDIDEIRTVKEAGDLIATVDEKLYALVEDKGDKYPFHLVCLQTFSVIQSYDSLPSNTEIEEDVGVEIHDVYDHERASIKIK